MKIVLGSDHEGLLLKNVLFEHLQTLGFDVHDIGTDSNKPVDYPDIAVTLALSIVDGSFDRGILVCGTGIGMAMTANKIAGIRAAQVHDIYTAERAIKSNDANVITMGAQVIGQGSAKMFVEAWLRAEFASGRSTRKVQKIRRIDEKYRSDIHVRRTLKESGQAAGTIDWKELTPPEASET
jgi:ribose 5-phosphate isomerase B